MIPSGARQEVGACSGPDILPQEDSSGSGLGWSAERYSRIRPYKLEPIVAGLSFEVRPCSETVGRVLEGAQILVHPWVDVHPRRGGEETTGQTTCPVAGTFGGGADANHSSTVLQLDQQARGAYLSNRDGLGTCYSPRTVIEKRAGGEVRRASGVSAASKYCGVVMGALHQWEILFKQSLSQHWEDNRGTASLRLLCGAPRGPPSLKIPK